MTRLKMTEEDVLGQIRQLLECNGARVYRIIERIPWGKTKSEGGIPDLDCWFPKGSPLLRDSVWREISMQTAVHFKIEVKRPGGRLRPKQTTYIAQANDDGVIAFKAESVEGMVAGFKKYGIEIKGL